MNDTLVKASPTHAAFGRRQAGFTLMELAVSLFMIVALLVAVLGLFDYSNKIARAQTHVADMQQSLRIAQYQMVRNVRMAGRGGLIRGPIEAPIAVGVRNNVSDGGADSFIAIGDADSPKVVAGTDVLTIRGVFSSPIYHINPPAASLTLELDPSTEQPLRGTIRIRDPIPETGVPQNLEPLIQAVQSGRPEALVLVSPLGGSLYGVVELNPGSSEIGDPTDVTLAFHVVGGTHTDEYSLLGPGAVFPQDLRSVAYLGLLEEYRYYVREQFAVADDPSSEPTHRLSQARFYPGTEVAFGGDPRELRLDIADNIMDLQLALGIDHDGDGMVLAKDDPPDAEDEWLFNHPDDDPEGELERWNGDGSGAMPGLHFVRINTLARTDRRDLKYYTDPIEAIEDRVYDEPAVPVTAEERLARSYRRRVMQSIVEMRNL